MAESNTSVNLAKNRKNNRIDDIVIIIVIEGEAYQTLDWSLGGFRIGGYEGDIRDKAEFMVNGIGPDLETIFAVRADCKAIRRTDNRLSATFIELDPNVFDILEALMLRRKASLEKLKNRLPYNSFSVQFLDIANENIHQLYEAFWNLAAATEDRKEALLEVYQKTLYFKDQGEKFGYGLLTAIGNELCRFIEKLDNVGPREIEIIKLHIESMKLVITKNIKGSGGAAGENILAGLQEVCARLPT